MDQSAAIFTLYTIMIYLMVAAMPMLAIMMIVTYFTKKAKKGYREITR